MDELYNKKILELAAHIERVGHLTAPDAKAQATSRLCGSKVAVELCIADGKVTDFAHQLEACALGQASSAIMARHIIGTGADELHKLATQMRIMLREGGEPPRGKWAELAILEPVRDFPHRHASTLLTFDAVEDCLQQLGL